MTTEPVTLDHLLAARETLIAAIAGDMPEAHKNLLMGFKRGEPDWLLLGVPDAADLPAAKWKQLNQDRLSSEARARLVAQLGATLRNREP
jgi:hypothetical protein